MYAFCPMHLGLSYRVYYPFIFGSRITYLPDNLKDCNRDSLLTTFRFLIQMYGLHFYDIAERHNIDKHWEMEKHGDFCDMNDFMHDNSPYLVNYVRLLLMGTPEVTSKSSPSKEVAAESTMEHMETVGK